MQEGFDLVALEYRTLTASEATQVYAHSPSQFCGVDQTAVIASMTQSPLWLCSLQRLNAVKSWLDLIGTSAMVDSTSRLSGKPDPKQAKSDNPFSLRASFGSDIVNNGFHGSSPTPVELLLTYVRVRVL